MVLTKSVRSCTSASWFLCAALFAFVLESPGLGAQRGGQSAPLPQDSMLARAEPEPSGMVSPEGWLGIALDCVDCGWMRVDRSRTPVWVGGLPKVSAVETGGPAARAGIVPGDVLVEIFGRSIVEDDSRQRFGAVRPGDKVTFTVLRHGAMERVTVTAEKRSDRAAGAAKGSGATQRLRYTGSVGPSRVDVWSLAPVSVDVDSAGGLIVRTETATVRIQPPKASITGKPLK
jgi:membrane-associated protease RseP (regulator of RpoE activity)